MSKIKVGLFGDLHLKPYDSLGSISNGDNTRLTKKFEILEQVIDLFKREGVTTVIETGDTYDRINPPDHVRNRYAYAVANFCLLPGNSYYRILGNHEVTGGKYGSSGEDVGVFSAGKYKVISEPTTILLHDDLPVVMIPEVSVEKIESYLTKYHDNMVFGHFGVNGMEFLSGDIEMNGVDPKYFSKRELPTYLGHIHKRQTINNNINFIGCVARANFSDRKASTGVTILTIDIEEYENPPKTIAPKVVNKHTVTAEYFPIQDTHLIELVYTEDKETSFSESDIKDSIVKVKYIGSKQWHMSMSPATRNSDLIKMGALKVFAEFKQNTNNAITEDMDFKEHSFEEMITIQAKEDKMDPAAGLQYLETAND